MREIKEKDLNQNIKIDITLKELDVIRACLTFADHSRVEPVLKNRGIKYELQERFALIKDCRSILESHGALIRSDEA